MRLIGSFPTKPSRYIVVALLLTFAGLAAWRSFHATVVLSVNGQPLGHLPGGVRPDDLNLLLVTLDTTRADRIHAYGFDAVETPNLDRLAREGVMFEEVV